MLRLEFGLLRLWSGVVSFVWWVISGEILEMYLVGGVASHGTVGTLSCASGRVDVRAKGGRVAVVRHDGCSRWYALMDELVIDKDELWSLSLIEERFLKCLQKRGIFGRDDMRFYTPLKV